MGFSIPQPFEFHSTSNLSSLVRIGLRAEESPAPTLATGIPPLDRCLPGGGLPIGGLSEVTGRRAAGKLSLSLALAARVLATGESVALVDPEATAAPDVWTHPALERLLIVRGGGVVRALRAASALLETGAFTLLVLDLPGRATTLDANGSRRAINLSSFTRLEREARKAATALVVLSEWVPWRTDGLAKLARLRIEVRRPPGQLGVMELTVVKGVAPGAGARVLLAGGLAGGLT